MLNKLHTGVVAVNEAQKVAGLLGYIIKHHLSQPRSAFEGLAWVIHDNTFKRQAANNNEKVSSNVSTFSFLLCFTSKS